MHAGSTCWLHLRMQSCSCNATSSHECVCVCVSQAVSRKCGSLKERAAATHPEFQRTHNFAALRILDKWVSGYMGKYKCIYECLTDYWLWYNLQKDQGLAWLLMITWQITSSVGSVNSAVRSVTDSCWCWSGYWNPRVFLRHGMAGEGVGLALKPKTQYPR